MATWNGGGTWNSGILWGPSAAPAANTTQPKKQTPMKRQNYWPKSKAQQPLWLRNFANKLEEYGPALAVPAGTVTSAALDARRTAHVLGEYNTAVREYGPAVTSFQTLQCYGTPGAVLALPAFVAPAVPANAGAVAAGSLTRIFALVGVIKGMPAYTEDIGLQMGIVGSEDTVVVEIPEFSLKLENGPGFQCVRAVFKKFGEEAVYIESRRGEGGVWVFLAVDSESPYLDNRPLLVAGQPEVREYRMRFYANDQPTGDWTPVQKVTVSP